MQASFTEQGLELVLESARYSGSMLHKCFYWYTRDYQVLIEPTDGGCTRVRLQPKEGAAFPAAILDQVHNDLLDFQLREMIAEETRTVRELLIAKAFAHYDTEQPLSTGISDPVGFHPLGEGQVV